MGEVGFCVTNRGQVNGNRAYSNGSYMGEVGSIKTSLAQKSYQPRPAGQRVTRKTPKTWESLPKWATSNAKNAENVGVIARGDMPTSHARGRSG